MPSWFSSLKSGLTCRLPEDRLAGTGQRPRIRDSLRPVLPFVRRHWRLGAAGAGLLVAGQLLSLPLPLVNRFLIDRVILARHIELLAMTLGVWVGLAGICWLAGTAENYCFTRFQQQVSLDLQRSLLQRILHFPKEFFDRTGVGYLMSRLTHDIYGMEWFFSASVVQLLGQTLRLVGGIVFLFYLEWRLALPAVAAAPLTWLSMWYFARRLYVINHRQQEQEAQVSRQFQETLTSASLIKAFATEERSAERVGEALQGRYLIRLEQLMVGALSGVGANVFFGAVRLLVLAAGAYWVIQGEWTVGSLLAFQSYLGYVFGPAMFLVGSQRTLQQSRASLDRVGALFAILPEPNVGIGNPVSALRGDIAFRNVNFSYDGRTPVLKDMSLAVPAGERVAIIGHSGAGKTTLISLVMQFYRPQAGEIRIDGEPAAAYELLSLRRRFGYVAQDNLLQSGTVLDNLRFGQPDATLATVRTAAATARIDEFIVGLPNGYETEIGERGVALSEGQRQRLCIARALVNAPDILILDEPTSALDDRTESSLFEKLLPVAVGKTMLVIAHRWETVRRADRVLLIENGAIAADGAPDDLARDNAAFRAFFPALQGGDAA